MKITRVRYYHNPRGRPLFNQSYNIVTIETDAGITGIGEGGSKDTVEQCAAMIIGEDPSRIEYLWQMMYRGYFYPAGREKLDALGALDPNPVLQLQVALLGVGQVGERQAEASDLRRRLGALPLGRFLGRDLFRLELGNDDRQVAVAAAPIDLQVCFAARLDAADDPRQIDVALDAAGMDYIAAASRA